MKKTKQIKKLCHFCQTTTLKPPLDNWIEEKHYQGKRVIDITYYCSIRCMEAQLDKEETEDWAKGKCAKCNVDLVVINEKCYDSKHKQEAKYLAIPTPECLKKKF